MHRLNAEAGAIPEPGDPVALAVTEESARLVWRAVPYLEARYGERGRRFGLSDAGWLTTLVAMPASARLAQIDWLAGVLSPRGIPSWLLEVQLEAMAKVGTRRGWSAAPAMREGARHLTARRQSRLADQDFAECGRRFAALAGDGRVAHGTGRLVASALVDVPLGYASSAAVTVDWLHGWRAARGALGPAVDAVVAFVTQAMGRS